VSDLVPKQDNTLSLGTSSLRWRNLYVNELTATTTTISGTDITLSGFDCSTDSNGGALTTDATGTITCSDDDAASGLGAFNDDSTYIYPNNSGRRFIYSYEGVQTTNAFFEVIGDEDIILRAGLAAAEYNLSGNNDLWIAAQDELITYAGDFTLTTSENSVDSLQLISAGTLRLDTSTNNSNIILSPGTGNVGIGTTAPNSILHVTSGADADSVSSVPTLIVGTTESVNSHGLQTRNTNYADGTSLILQSGTYGSIAYTPDGGNSYPFYVNNDGETYIAGNVGIGSTSPGGILDVVGDSSIILRGGLGARQDATTDGDDIQISAEGALTLDGSGFTLTTSSGSAGSLNLVSAGSLVLDTSANNTEITLGAGSGEIDLTTTGTIDINVATLDIDATSEVQIDGALVDIGSGTYTYADGDDDLGIAGNLEVTGSIYSSIENTINGIDISLDLGTIDQQQTTSTVSVSAPTPIGQSFTAGTTGELSAVEICAYSSISSATIRAGEDINGTVLGTADNHQAQPGIEHPFTMAPLSPVGLNTPSASTPQALEELATSTPVVEPTTAAAGKAAKILHLEPMSALE
jgi:hypothetical protein